MVSSDELGGYPLQQRLVAVETGTMELVRLTGLGDVEAEQLLVAWQESNSATAQWELSLQKRTEIWTGLASLLTR